MKKYFSNIGAILLCLLIASCSKDGDFVTVGQGDAVSLNGSNVVKLDENNPDGLALSIYWNDNHELSTNYSNVLIPDYSITNTIEISRTADFANPYRLSVDKGSYEKQYTNKELNSELTKLFFTPYVEQDMYVRIAAATGPNITPLYSNTMVFRVMPYKIDYSVGYVLNSDKSESGSVLRSPTENGIYSGFLALGAWGNWWFKESDGTLWGNDDVTETAYVISNSATAWNFWASPHNGCRYVTVDTKKKYWEEIDIPSVAVAGGISGDMQFDKAENRWVLSFTAASTSPVSFTLSSNDAQKWDQTTGTNEGAGIATPIVFTSDGISTDAADAQEFTLVPPVAGECTLVIDFAADGKAVDYRIDEGGVGPIEKTNPILCVMGNDDKWDHTEWIRLSDEDNKTYTGAVYMNSSWGYYFTKTTDSDDWTQIGQDPDTSDMKLKEGGGNITAPGQGLYVVSASLGWMSYWYEMDGAAITSVAYTGLGDDWSITEMTPTTTPGIYTATINAAKATPWGVQILINGSWDNWFGTCSDGTLVWKKKNDGDPVGVVVGTTQTLTVDICRGTYTIE